MRDCFRKNNESDHGLCDFLMELWDQMHWPHRDRLEALQNYSRSSDCKDLYRKLETATTYLAEIVHPVFKIISLKERKFGNITQARFNTKEHTSEYHSLRLEIAKGLDAFKLKHSKDLEWCGFPYVQLLRLERASKLEED